MGVLIYDIAEEQERHECLAIMFSVPYNYSKFQNQFALGFFEKRFISEKSMEGVYKIMANENEKVEVSQKTFSRMKTNGSENSYKGNKCKIRGTMTPMSKSVMKVELWDN